MTLVELVVVIALLGLIASLTFPAASAGIDSLRLRQVTSELVSFFNQGLDRAERRQQVVQVSISKAQRTLWLHSSEPGFERKLVLPEGISIVRVLPEIDSAEEDALREFALYPGGAVPRLGVEISNERRVHRLVRVDPITGVPQVEEVQAP